jgi:calcineurin-like phosphoesterase family protein
MKSLFYSPVKETAKNHQVLFWGCLHYKHNPSWENPIWKMRGFNSSEEHDLAIVQNWNNKASHETIGFLLGDVVFGRNATNDLLFLAENLQYSRIYIMPGNHQAGWKQLFESVDQNVYRASHGGELIFVPNYLEAYVNGQPIVMSHYPILSWNGQGKGSWMLFSHVHGSLSRSEVGHLYILKGYNREVSVEKAPSPLSYGEIHAEMRQKEWFSPDRHDASGNTPFS